MIQFNVDPKTGIHYGVIGGNSERLPEWWFDDFSQDCSKCTSSVDCEDDEDNFCWSDISSCDKDDFKASYNSNTNEIMIFFSDNIEICNLCSPCFPNAGNLEEVNEFGIETYSLPKRWLEK